MSIKVREDTEDLTLPKDKKDPLSTATECGPIEEEIIALIFDQPEYASSVIGYWKPEYFTKTETKFVFSLIQTEFDTHNKIPSRNFIKQLADENLTTEDPYEAIHRVIATESEPRDVEGIKAKLTDWAKKQIAGQLSKAYADAMDDGDYEKVEELQENLKKITNVDFKFKFFFNDYKERFNKENIEHFTTGFPTLDVELNDGGPAKEDVFCYIASTGVGKSIALVNTACANIKKGKNVLYISMELSANTIYDRCIGCLSGQHIKDRDKPEINAKMTHKIDKIKKNFGSELVIIRVPSYETIAGNIVGMIDSLKSRHGIKIDVVVVDYLELMTSKHADDKNGEEYQRQKFVSGELRNVAEEYGLVVFTATQANRSAHKNGSKKKTTKIFTEDNEMIDLEKLADSYAKAMGMPYCVSINKVFQVQDEENLTEKKEENLTIGQFDLYVAKNNNGRDKFKVRITVDYLTMKMDEVKQG